LKSASAISRRRTARMTLFAAGLRVTTAGGVQVDPVSAESRQDQRPQGSVPSGSRRWFAREASLFAPGLRRLSAFPRSSRRVHKTEVHAIPKGEQRMSLSKYNKIKICKRQIQLSNGSLLLGQINLYFFVVPHANSISMIGCFDLSCNCKFSVLR